MKISRREFNVGIASSFIFPFLGCSKSNWITASRKIEWTKGKPKVIVVGAGLSGLMASLCLTEADVDVTLLEKEPRVGGRIYAEPLGGTYVNLGAQYFFKSDSTYMNRYIKKMKKFSPERGLLGALWDGKFVTAYDEKLFHKLPIERTALEHLDRAARQMKKARKKLSKGREFIFDKAPASQLWFELDNMSASEYLSNYHPDVTNLYNTFLTPEGGVGASKTSALLLVGWYGGPENETYLIEGGNQKLTEAIAEDIIKLGGRLYLSTEITEVIHTDSGVKVHGCEGNSFEAEYVIVTTPTTVARKILKDIAPEKRDALEAVKYGASMQVGLHLSNFHSDKRIKSCFFHNEKVNAYMDQTKEYKDNETVISLNIAGEEPHMLDDDGIIKRVSAPLKKIYPDFDPKQSILDYKIKKWTDGIALYPSGLLTKFQEKLREPSGKIYFGGDYTHNPALDGAAWSGVRAANQVLNALRDSQNVE